MARKNKSILPAFIPHICGIICFIILGNSSPTYACIPGHQDEGNALAGGQNRQANQQRIDSLFTALETAKDSNIVITFNALCLEYKKKPDIALKYGRQALNLARDIGFKKGIAMSLENIGVVYQDQGDYTKAIEYYQQSLKIWKKLGDKPAIRSCLNNIGRVYDDQGKPEKASDYYQQLLKIEEKLNRIDSLVSYKQAITSELKNIETLQTRKDNFKKVVELTKKSLAISIVLGEKEDIKESYKNLSETYSKMAEHAATYRKRGDYLKEAYQYYQLYSELQQYLLEIIDSAKIAKMQALVEAERKDKEIQLLKKENKIKYLKARKNKIWMTALTGGLILILVLAGVIYSRYRIKQKANALLAKKNKQITDSINYAKRIQNAILPPDSLLRDILPESFVFFKPRDIVSGDYYWFSKVDQKIVIAAADCTGHGVPGAFMSMIGTTLMNEIINEKQNTDPAAILNQLHAAVIDALKQNNPDAESQDGMDIALCCIDLRNKFVQYAGAMNPLYVVHNESLDVIKADIKSIGGKTYRHHIKTERKFTNHQIPIYKGMTIYISSDGYLDQFGSEERKKFGSQKFKQLLLDNSNLDMQKQKDALSKTISEWQAAADQPGKSCKQIDDMLVMGVKF